MDTAPTFLASSMSSSATSDSEQLPLREQDPIDTPATSQSEDSGSSSFNISEAAKSMVADTRHVTHSSLAGEQKELAKEQTEGKTDDQDDIEDTAEKNTVASRGWSRRLRHPGIATNSRKRNEQEVEELNHLREKTRSTCLSTAEKRVLTQSTSSVNGIQDDVTEEAVSTPELPRRITRRSTFFSTRTKEQPLPDISCVNCGKYDDVRTKSLESSQRMTRRSMRLATTAKEQFASSEGKKVENVRNEESHKTTRPLRRSARASAVMQLSQALGKDTAAESSLSRRPHAEILEKEAALKRRKGLRSRNNDAHEIRDEGRCNFPKRPQSVDPHEVDQSQTKNDPEDKEGLSPRKKIWLSHGLYATQKKVDKSTVPANLRCRKSRKPMSTGRQLFPLPMHAGADLLERGRDFKLPFDIFSPLPYGSSRPEEWRRTNKNVFVDEAASIWKAAKIDESSTCMCTPQTGCNEYCQNRYMFYECDQHNCKLGSELCGNRSFANLRQRLKAGGKYNIGVEVMLTKDRGYGVRSNRTFAPNQIIVEYTGEIITQEECERRTKKLYKNNESYYIMYFDQNMLIDATRGSIARFVNHSCEPNCRMEKWTVSGRPRMALFAGDNGIMTGEELTYDYNFNPYSDQNVQKCRCGTLSCRGFLGPRSSKDSRKTQNDKNMEKPKNKKPERRKRRAGTDYNNGPLPVSKKRKRPEKCQVKRARSAVPSFSGEAATSSSRKRLSVSDDDNNDDNDDEPLPSTKKRKIPMKINAKGIKSTIRFVGGKATAAAKSKSQTGSSSGKRKARRASPKSTKSRHANSPPRSSRTKISTKGQVQQTVSTGTQKMNQRRRP